MQALVTGAAKRLGRTIALTLHGAGYRVAVHYRSSRAEAEQTAALMGGAPLIQGDQAKDPERIVHEAARAPGGAGLLGRRAAPQIQPAPRARPLVQIGKAHGRTPVTSAARMPASGLKKKKNNVKTFSRHH